MKIQQYKADIFINNPDPKIRGVLFYGTDHGLVNERAKIFIHTILKGNLDPFKYTCLDARKIKEDPIKLADEFSTLSLVSGTRVVKITDCDDSLTKIISNSIDKLHSEIMVVFISSDLGPRSSLRKLFEVSNAVLSLPCYNDDPVSIKKIAEQAFNNANLRILPDALDWLVAHSGADRALSRNEIEKLILYKISSDNNVINIDDTVSSVGDTASFDFDDLVFSMAAGNRYILKRAFDRIITEGHSPISIVSFASRHLMRLLKVRGDSEELSTEDAIKKLKPAVFFKRMDQFKAQVKVWKPKLILRALEILSEVELKAKSSDMPAQILIERALFQISTEAKRLSESHSR